MNYCILLQVVVRLIPYKTQVRKYVILSWGKTFFSHFLLLYKWREHSDTTTEITNVNLPWNICELPASIHLKVTGRVVNSFNSKQLPWFTNWIIKVLFRYFYPFQQEWGNLHYHREMTISRNMKSETSKRVENSSLDF